MYESLAGRLKWEQAENEIRVRIPGRFTLRFIVEYYMIPATCIVLLYLLAKSCAVIILYFHPHPHPHQMTWWTAFISGFLSAFSLTVGAILARITARTTLTLNPTTMKIETHSAGFRRGTVVYATANLSDLRLARYSLGVTLQNHFRMNEIQFQANSQIQSFASGIKELEAETLIARMKEIYPFSNKLTA